MQAAQLAADADALLEPEEPTAACLPRILSSKDHQQARDKSGLSHCCSRSSTLAKGCQQAQEAPSHTHASALAGLGTITFGTSGRQNMG